MNQDVCDFMIFFHVSHDNAYLYSQYVQEDYQLKARLGWLARETLVLS